jgi:hypothetical protein
MSVMALTMASISCWLMRLRMVSASSPVPARRRASAAARAVQPRHGRWPLMEARPAAGPSKGPAVAWVPRTSALRLPCGGVWPRVGKSRGVVMPGRVPAKVSTPGGGQS